MADDNANLASLNLFISDNEKVVLMLIAKHKLECTSTQGLDGYLQLAWLSSMMLSFKHPVC